MTNETNNQETDVETPQDEAVNEEATAEDTEAPVAEAETEDTAEVEAEATDDAEAEAPVAEAETEDTEAEAEAPVAEAETEAAEDAAEAETEDTEAETEAPVAEAETEDAPRAIEDLTVGMELTGTVKAIELYGAFVDVGVGKDALLHISQLGQQNVRNVEDVVKKGEKISVFVIKADASNGRIALSLEKPPENAISDLRVGDVVTGKVVRIENFGAFIDIGAERPGMVHVSELATEYINSPEDKVSIGQQVQVKVIKVNRKRRQIDLSIKALEEEEQRQVIESMNAEESDEPMPTTMEIALRRAMSDTSDEEAVAQANENKKKRNSKKSKKALNEALQRTLKQDI